MARALFPLTIEAQAPMTDANPSLPSQSHRPDPRPARPLFAHRGRLGLDRNRGSRGEAHPQANGKNPARQAAPAMGRAGARICQAADRAARRHDPQIDRPRPNGRPSKRSTARSKSSTGSIAIMPSPAPTALLMQYGEEERARLMQKINDVAARASSRG